MSVENTNYMEYLIDLSKSGRRRPFIDLCEINLRNVFTVSYRLLSNYDAAQKITLHAFIRAWEKIKDYNGKEAFSTWLKNLAIGYAIDVLQREDIKITRGDNKVKISSEPELLESLIISLPTEDRIIFVLHDLEGYDYREIQNIFKEKVIDEIKTNLIKTREHLMSKLTV